MKAAFVCIPLLALTMVSCLLGIWFVDERWFNTAGVTGAASALTAIYWLIVELPGDAS